MDIARRRTVQNPPQVDASGGDITYVRTGSIHVRITEPGSEVREVLTRQLVADHRWHLEDMTGLAPEFSVD